MNSQFRSEVAETTADLINSGLHDPQAPEIADAHFGKAITSVMLESLREQLPAIRDILVDDYGMQAHIVNPYYYQHMRSEPIETMEQAQEALCGGRGRSAEGIRVPNSNQDFILQATIDQNIRSGAGKTSKNYNSAYKSLLAGDLTERQALELVRRERDTFVPLLKITKELHSRGAIDDELFSMNLPELPPAH